MVQRKNFRLMLAGIAALILISVAVACQPTVEMEDTPAPPLATPAAETDRQQEQATIPTIEVDSPQPPPATQAPAAADTTLPDLTLPVPTSKIPEPLETGPAQMPHRDEIGLSPEAEKVIVLTRKDLAQRLSVAEEVILIQSIEPVTWPDASLGCPQPGMAYAQVLTPGFRVIVEAGGEIYEVHTDIGNTILICEESEQGQAPARDPDASVQDGWPNESRDPDLIIVPPPQRD